MRKPRKALVAQHLRCLLVEDNPDHAQLIHECLHKKLPHLDLTRVETLPEAVTALKATRFALVITSLELGHQSLGAALSTLVRAAGRLPVLVLSGNNHAQAAAEAHQHGISDFRVKERETLQQLPGIVTTLLQQPGRRAAVPAAPHATQPTTPLPQPTRALQSTVDALVATIHGWIETHVAPARPRLQAILRQLQKLQQHLGPPHPKPRAR